MNQGTEEKLEKYIIDYTPKQPGAYGRVGSFPLIRITSTQAAALCRLLDSYFPEYTHTPRRVDHA